MSVSSAAARRVALVTGGNKGIGYEVVRQLASADSKLLVLLGTRDLARGQEAARKLNLPNVQPFTIDVTSTPSLESAVSTFRQQHPEGLDLLVNNAGVFGTREDDVSGKPEIIDKTLAVNYFGPKHTTKAFWPLLNQNASVVNVSSQLSQPAYKALSAEHRAIVNSPELTEEQLDALLSEFRAAGAQATAKGFGNSVYGISKVAVSALARIWAKQGKEDPRNIKVNSACPGWCRTDMTSAEAPLSAEEGGSRIAFVCTSADRTGEFWANRQVDKLFEVTAA